MDFLSENRKGQLLLRDGELSAVTPPGRRGARGLIHQPQQGKQGGAGEHGQIQPRLQIIRQVHSDEAGLRQSQKDDLQVRIRIMFGDHQAGPQ